MIALYKDIKITKGYGRSLLQDLTKGNFEFISNEMFSILSNLERYSDLKDCIEKNPQEEDELISLSKLNIFNTSSSVHTFPEISDLNYHPFDYQAITFEYTENIGDFLLNNSDVLSRLTHNIYICFDESNISFIQQLNEAYKDRASLRFVFCGKTELMLQMESEIDVKDITYDFYEFNPINKEEYYKSWPTLHNNWMAYRDNLKYNSGFVEKLFIHKDEHISINYFDEINLGLLSGLKTVDDFISLKENKQYKDITSITTEKITVCRDCEMRNICVDVKLPVQTKYDSNLYFKPECRYNPYISLWSHEDYYKNLNDCGIINDENQFLLKDEEIVQLNEEIWS